MTSMKERTLAKKTAVVLLNVGGPSSQEEVYPFLLSFFSDPAIIPFSSPFREVFSKMISKIRLSKAKKIYAQLGGGSPLRLNTQKQATALQQIIGENSKVFVAMRHAPPFISDVFKDVLEFSPEEVILLPLVPQYSTTTTGSFFKEWERVSAGTFFPMHKVFSYPTQEGFIKALQELTLVCYERATKKGSPYVLLTAHGLPERIITKGDPYQRHVEETATALKEQLKLPDVSLGYQSRVGFLPWLKPYLEEEVIRISRQQRPLVVVPLSFVSEHSETLVELDVTLRKIALKEGCPAYERVPTVSTHTAFIEGLACLVKSYTH